MKIVEDAIAYGAKCGKNELNDFVNMFIPKEKINEILINYIRDNYEDFKSEAVAYLIDAEEYLVCIGCKKLFPDNQIGSRGYCMRCHDANQN